MKKLFLSFLVLGSLFIVAVIFVLNTNNKIEPVKNIYQTPTKPLQVNLEHEEDIMIQTKTVESDSDITMPEQSENKSSILTNLINKVVEIKEKVITNSYLIVDTGVVNFYNNDSKTTEPNFDQDFYGQDANYKGNQPSYTNNQDGTITDNVTKLTWQQDMGQKMTFTQAQTAVKTFNLNGNTDWRIPTIKELYSLIQFTGEVSGQTAKKLYIDDNYFNQPLGNTAIGEREIDAQTWSTTFYTGKTMTSDVTLFGVNFVDGRIKGYPLNDPRTKQEKKMYFRFVRGNTEYGKNNFVDNKDGTISDLETGLMWQQADSKKRMDWEEALQYSEDLNFADYSDWRLPNPKELQSIVDYTRSPQFTNSAAIDPIFAISSIIDEKNQTNYPFFWTGTTHLDGIDPESGAVYFSFGEALGKMNNQVLDVHGAGSQRSDPKSGIKSQYPQYFGPQGDVRRVYNYVRAVRNID